MTITTDEFQHILAIHPNPVVVHVNFNPLYCNDAFARFSGLEHAGQILEMDSLMVLICPDEHEDAHRRYQQAMQYGETKPKVIAHTDLHGNPVLVEIIDKPIIWQGQQALCTFISIVTDTIKREQRLKRLAEQDYLTKLPNRRYISQVLDKLAGDGETAGYYQAILDIDFFKKVNDEHGHIAGDHVLQQLAKILSDDLQAGDHLTRLGGEEFVLLVKSDSIQQVKDRLNQLRSTVERTPFDITEMDDETQTKKIHCTLSIGVTPIQPDEALGLSYRRADKALYHAKHQGRNQVVLLD